METSTEQPVNPGVIVTDLDAQAPETPVTPVEPPKEAAPEVKPEAPKQKGEMPEWMKERLRKNADQKRQKDEEIARLSADNRRLTEELGKLKPPTIDQFQNHEEYQAALIAHHTRANALDMERSRVSSNLQTAQGEAQQTDIQIWSDRVQQARTLFPDFDTTVNGSTLPLSRDLSAAITHAPNGAIVSYILAKNPQEGYRLTTMTYPELLQEFIRIEERFAQSRLNAAPPKPPIKPIGGAGVPAPASAYKEWEAEANRKRGLY